jgi:hypothetical protein
MAFISRNWRGNIGSRDMAPVSRWTAYVTALIAATRSSMGSFSMMARRKRRPSGSAREVSTRRRPSGQ